MTHHRLLGSSGATAALPLNQLPVGSRLPGLLREQRNVPDWAYAYPELFDPLRLFTKIMLICGVINLLLLPLWFLMDLALGSNFLGQRAAAGFLITFGGYAITVPRGRTNAFYLRSFATDRRTHAFRVALEIGLGSDFRLSGIRSPRRAWPDLLKGAAGGFALLRYAGGRYMELEAGRGWMGRLLASLVHARIAFVDLRELTDNVRREAVLTFLCLGPNRTVFVIDRTRSAHEWAAVASDLVVRPGTACPALQFVDAEGTLATITSQVRRAVQRLPDGAAGFSEAGWSYVAKNVPEADLVAESRRKPGRTVLVGVVMVAIAVSVAPSDLPGVMIWPLVLFLTLFFVCFARAFFGAARRAWKARSVNREFAGGQLERVLAGACLPVLGAVLTVSAAEGAARFDESQPPAWSGYLSVPTAGAASDYVSPADSLVAEPDSVLFGP